MVQERMHRILHHWFQYCSYFTLTLCYLHKDLHSLEFKQPDFQGAHYVKTALLEVTDGLCRAELSATLSSTQYFSQMLISGV